MEIWKDVVGYEGRYQVSSLGRVKSLPNSRRKTELILKLNPHVKSGHLLAGLTDSHEGKWRQRAHYVHALVLTAFVGPCPRNLEGCHGDGNPTNNALDNLRWDTRASNMADRAAHGADNKGSRNGQSKLDEGAVKDIKARLGKGEKVTAIAAIYGITHGAVGHIKNGRQWGHV